jgi:hypothetical protein
MGIKPPLLIGLLMLSACGATTSVSQSTPASSPKTTASATAASSSSAAAAGVDGLATCGSKPALGILGAVAASATNPDGSARNPSASFPAATTTQLIVVLSVQGLPAGAKLSFTRYLDGKFVDSKSALIAKATPHFYFNFTPQAGKQLATGTYLLRLYVNEARACTIGYTVV